jgi:serine protease Do
VSAFLRIACFAAVTLAGVAWAAEPAPSGGALSLLRQLDAGFVEVFEKVAPAVVVIDATKKTDPDDRELREFEPFLEGKEPRVDGGEREWPLPSHHSEGSGFIIRADGYVLTNHHVVADTEKITVRLRDGRSFPGEVWGVDDKTDIAIVRIKARDLPAVQIGDSDAVRVGQLVCAIGAPFNQHFSFSVGWVSGKGRNSLLGPSAPNILYEDYLQTDTFINPGNSGGPLFDVAGRVIGMNTLINGIGRGLAFAIPSSMFQEVAQQLIAHRRIQRAWLGITMDTLSDRHPRRAEIVGVDRGVVVDRIQADSPAFNSQLRAADVIVEIDGTKVNAALDLQKEILRKKIGATVQLKVWRGGKIIQIPVATGELPEKYTKVANVRPGKLGVESRAESLGLGLRDAPGSGAVVASIVPGSAADRAAMRAEDVITEVGGRPVRDAAAVVGAIGDRLRAAPDQPVVLNVQRKGESTVVAIAPDR